MKNIKKQTLTSKSILHPTCWLVALALSLLHHSALADYSYADSAKFSINVYPVNRSYSTSNLFEVTIKGDIDGDKTVNVNDLIILSEQWLCQPGYPSADIAPPQSDNVINFLDFSTLVDNWLKGGQ